MTALLTIPNWLRLVLIVISALSFLPQLRLLWLRRDVSGISLYYVLFNTIVATELFTLSFFLTVNNIDKPGVFVHYPPNAGDRLNLAQLTAVWLLWLVILAACLVLPAAEERGDRPVKKVWVLYVAFLAISVIPVFVDAIFAHLGEEDWPRKWFGALFSGIHMLYLQPPITAFGLAALFYQARVILTRPPEMGMGSLSLLSLVLQVVVFAVLTIMWPWRLVFPWEEFGRIPFLPHLVNVWYQLVGFVPVDHAVFTGAQGFLLWLALRHRRAARGMPAGEAEPLLRGETRR